MSSYYSFRNDTTRDINLGIFTIGRTRAYQTYRIQSVPFGEEVHFRRNYHIRFTILDPEEEDIERAILASVQMDPVLEIHISNTHFVINIFTDSNIVLREENPVVV